MTLEEAVTQEVARLEEVETPTEEAESGGPEEEETEDDVVCCCCCYRERSEECVARVYEYQVCLS